MIASNKMASLVINPISIVVSNELKRFMKKEINFATFWGTFDSVAKLIARTGFETTSTGYPKVFNFKDCVEITLTAPYTLNTVSAIFHGGKWDATTISVRNPKKKMISITTSKITDGVLFETPLTLIVHALIQREFVRLRNDKIFPSLDSLGKSRALAQLSEIEKQIDSLDELPAAAYLFPENIFLVQENDLFINSYMSTPWLNGITRVSGNFLSQDNSGRVNDYFNKTTDVYKGVFGIAGSIEDIKVELKDVGILVEPRAQWLRIPNYEDVEMSMSVELRQYLMNHSSQVLAMFPHFLKNTYYGMQLTGSEMAGAMVDFTNVLSKLFGRKLSYDPGFQANDKYELLASIFAGLETPMHINDIIDLMYQHQVRVGGVSWTLADANAQLTLSELELLRGVTSDLANKVSDIMALNKYEYNAVSDTLNLICPTRKLVLNPVWSDSSIINDSKLLHKAVFNPQSEKSYRALELLEALEGLYLATLNPNTTTANLFSIDRAVYKFRISSYQLNKQLHYGFIGADPVIMMASGE